MTLPAAGRQGSAPKWPLSSPTVLIDGKVVALKEVAKRELALWAGEWKRPQAVEWERNGQELEVALYVRSLVAAEHAEATTAARTLVRQQQEALGISLPGLARNRWTIENAPRQAAASKPSTARAARARFRVVSGGGDAD